MNNFFISMAHPTELTLHLSRESAELVSLLHDLKEAWSQSSDGRSKKVLQAENALRYLDSGLIFISYTNACRNPGNRTRQKAVTDWCDKQLKALDHCGTTEYRPYAPSVGEQMDDALTLTEKSLEPALETHRLRAQLNRMADAQSFAEPGKDHPGTRQTLLNRKTERDSREHPTRDMETALLERKLPTRAGIRNTETCHTTSEIWGLDIKTSWEKIVNALEPSDKKTALVLQSTLKSIALGCRTRVDTDFLTAMCTNVRQLKRYLVRFRENETREVELLKRMVELDLHRSAGTLCRGRGFISEPMFHNLKILHETFGEDIQNAITGMQGGRGIPEDPERFKEFLDNARKLIGLCTFQDRQGNFKLNTKLFISVSGMQYRKGIPDLDKLKALMRLCIVKDEQGNFIQDKLGNAVPNTRVFSSVTGMQNGKGMPHLDALKALMSLCTFKDEQGNTLLNTRLFASVTGMLNGKGIPDLGKLRALMSLCALRDEQGNAIQDKFGNALLNARLFASVTSMQAHKGMPDIDKLKALMSLCALRDEQGNAIKDKQGNVLPDTSVLSSVAGMQHGKGIPDLDELKASMSLCALKDEQGNVIRGELNEIGQGMVEHLANDQADLPMPHAFPDNLMEDFAIEHMSPPDTTLRQWEAEHEYGYLKAIPSIGEHDVDNMEWNSI